MAFIWRVQHPCPCRNQPLCLSAVVPHTHPLPPLQNPTRPNHQLADIASLGVVMNKRGEKQTAGIWKQKRRTCSAWGRWSMIIPPLEKRTRVIVIGMHCYLNWVEGAKDATPALRWDSNPVRWLRDVAVFDDEPHKVALEVLVVGVPWSPRRKRMDTAILRIVKRRLRVITRVHELARLNFRTWNTNS